MGFIRQSFKRQIFVIILTVTLVMVIFGGILTLQGFRSRIIADYEGADLEREHILNERLGKDFALIEAERMRKTIIILIVIGVLLVLILHLCPDFEAWLHQVTGWY